MDCFNYLLGKKLVDISDVTSLDETHVAKNFVEKLAKQNGFNDVRYCSESGFTDMQFKEDRLKVTTDKSGVIKKVALG